MSHIVWQHATFSLGLSRQGQPPSTRAGQGSGSKIRPQKGSGRSRRGAIGAAGTRGGAKAHGPAPKAPARGNRKAAIAAHAALSALVGAAALAAPPPALLSAAALRAWALAAKGGARLLLVGSATPRPDLERAAANLQGVEIWRGRPPLARRLKADAEIFLP